MIIKVLGSGCSNCKKLEEHTKKAVKELGIEAQVIKVQDYREIMAYGVMKTPALVVNEQVRVMGRVPKVKEIIEILKR
jgi:small redox-active disulfide protein 2